MKVNEIPAPEISVTGGKVFDRCTDSSDALAAQEITVDHMRDGKTESWLRGRDLNPRPRGYEPRELTELLYPDLKNVRPSFGGLCDGQKVIRRQLNALLLRCRNQSRHVFKRDNPP